MVPFFPLLTFYPFQMGRLYVIGFVPAIGWEKHRTPF